MAYLGQSLTEGTRRVYNYVATASQTTFNAVYGVGAVDVYQNGVLLAEADYVATTGTTVVLGTGAAVNDEITIACHNTFSVADTVSASAGGTFAADIDVTGTITSAALTSDFFTVTNEIRLEGDTGSNALVQKNASAGRDELQIYSGGDAYSTGSRGAGIQLYGNSDNQHDGNFAVLTGPDDNGDGRIIASGREDKTHVTIGNDIFDYVDDGDDHALLNLKGASSQPALLIEGASATEGDIVTVTGESMQFGHWDKASTTFTEAMRIDSSGNLLVGTTNNAPATNNVDGISLRSAGHINVSRSSGVVGYFNRRTSDGTILDFRKDGAPVGNIGSRGVSNSSYINFGGGGLTSTTAAVGAIMPTNASGDATDNTMSLGYSSFRFKDLYLSGGIQFDSRSNKLDDYEEGTWTPELRGGSTAGTGIAYGSRSGFYTKIGNMVTVWGTLDVNDSGTATGQFQIHGLPFPCTQEAVSICQYNRLHTALPSNVSYVAMIVQNSQSYMHLRAMFTNGATGPHFPSPQRCDYMRWTLNYRTDS